MSGRPLDGRKCRHAGPGHELFEPVTTGSPVAGLCRGTSTAQFTCVPIRLSRTHAHSRKETLEKRPRTAVFSDRRVGLRPPNGDHDHLVLIVAAHEEGLDVLLGWHEYAWMAIASLIAQRHPAIL